MRPEKLINIGEKTTPRLVQLFLALIVSSLVVFAAGSPKIYAQSSSQLDQLRSFEQIYRLLNTEQVEAAKTRLDALKKKAGDAHPELDFLSARYEFLSGEYQKAVDLLDRAIEEYGDQSIPAHWDEYRELIRSTHEVTQGYQKFTTPKGHFEIHLPPGKDQVLVPFAAEALDLAYDEIGKELGFYPPTPIRLEVYPQTATLAQVSSLSEEEIRTSGTIALCKYNRLMITSPRALLQGYSWVDTVVHEYVHYVISAKTQNRVPIWMHEGLAKFLERRWRGPDAEQLPPSAEGLLKERVKKDDLITFEQMHPSMAKLPSQEDAAVAFAEVYTVMEYLKREVGQDGFKRLLDNINTGLEADQAFAKTIGKPFSDFEKDWLAYLKTRETARVPKDTHYQEELVFKDQAQEASDLAEIEKPQARQYMQLGEMMQARERCGAALVEYEKAAHLLGDENPALQTRRAQCLLEERQPKDALKMLESVHALYPSYTQAWVEMGTAALAIKDYARARDYLNEAARINPFDPAVHERLAEVYAQLGDAESADKFRGFAQMVR